MSRLDDLIEELRLLFESTPLPPDPSEEERSKLKKFFFGGPKEEDLGEFQKLRRKDGLCPKCGKKGRIHLSAFICEDHGEY